MTDALVVIREFANEIEAEIARSVLDAHGIAAAVLRDNAGGMLPAMQLLFPVQLAVATRDRFMALAILDAPVTDAGAGGADVP